MNNHNQSYPSYQGVNLLEIPGAFGPLMPSTDLLHDPDALRARMREQGYLYMPGLLDRGKVLEARASLAAKLEQGGLLDPSEPRDALVARTGVVLSFRPDLANGDGAVETLLYQGRMMGFWQTFLGTEVCHFDYTWLRAKSPGDCTVTEPHCDIVFMSRGTPDLYTAWTPLGDVPFDLGGLMVLEGSHHRDDVLGEYWKMDVDTYCTNGAEAAKIESGAQTWQSDKQNGVFQADAVGLRQRLNSRWLGTEFRAGDVLVFGMHTLHAAADNRTRRIRLSTDSRYQRAGEAMDERWVGPNPVGHGANAKRGMIC